MGSVALAIGAVIATGQEYWPTEEAPAYLINQTVPSYSEVTEQILVATRNPHSTFVDQMASIYASFSERQELLGEEFEAAIFDDLDSLYES
jgi:tRNA(Met) C34 N-acetyltransferase TmcA